MIMINKIMIMLRWARAGEENSFSWMKKDRLPELIMIPMIILIIIMVMMIILIIIMIMVIILTIIMVMIIMMIAHFLEPKVSDAPTKLINDNYHDNYHNNDVFSRRLKDQRLLLNCQPQLRNLSQRKTR